MLHVALALQSTTTCDAQFVMAVVAEHKPTLEHANERFTDRIRGRWAGIGRICIGSASVSKTCIARARIGDGGITGARVRRACVGAYAGVLLAPRICGRAAALRSATWCGRFAGLHRWRCLRDR